MTSFSTRIDYLDDQHMRMSVFAGPDADHRALAGQLTLRHQEAGALMEAMPVDTLAEVTPTVAAHVLFHYGLAGGYAPGSFIAQLLRTIANADVVNRALLSLSYPGYVAAAGEVERSAQGAATLQEIAGRAAA